MSLLLGSSPWRVLQLQIRRIRVLHQLLPLQRNLDQLLLQVLLLGRLIITLPLKTTELLKSRMMLLGWILLGLRDDLRSHQRAQADQELRCCALRTDGIEEVQQTLMSVVLRGPQ